MKYETTKISNDIMIISNVTRFAARPTAKGTKLVNILAAIMLVITIADSRFSPNLVEASGKANPAVRSGITQKVEKTENASIMVIPS